MKQAHISNVFSFYDYDYTMEMKSPHYSFHEDLPRGNILWNYDANNCLMWIQGFYCINVQIAVNESLPVDNEKTAVRKLRQITKGVGSVRLDVSRPGSVTGLSAMSAQDLVEILIDKECCVDNLKVNDFSAAFLSRTMNDLFDRKDPMELQIYWFVLPPEHLDTRIFPRCISRLYQSELHSFTCKNKYDQYESIIQSNNKSFEAWRQGQSALLTLATGSAAPSEPTPATTFFSHPLFDSRLITHVLNDWLVGDPNASVK